MSLNEDLSPCVLNTPSLVVSTAINQNSSQSASDTSYISTPSTTTMASLIMSSNSFENPVGKIKNNLRQSFREPTTSPFQTLLSLSPKTQTKAITREEMIEPSSSILLPPSTAEVVRVIESIQNTKLSKTEVTTPLESAHIRELITTPDSSLSPKKKILLRSQSENELTPTTTASQIDLQSQFLPINDTTHKSHKEENLSTESKVHAPIMISNTDNNTNNHISIQNNIHRSYGGATSPISSNNKYVQIIIENQLHTFQLDQHGHTHILKDGEMQPTNKRAFQQININNDETSGVIVQNQQNMSNEVTSSDQSLHQVKRQKVVSTVPAGSNSSGVNSHQPHVVPPVTTNIYPQHQPPITQQTFTGTTEGDPDTRRQQIRESNREAARRCRERRRQYIETLEANLDQQKQQNQKLELEIQHLKRENSQLKTILNETTLNKLSRSSAQINGQTDKNITVTNDTDINKFLQQKQFL
ncbi:unnamed protein product [Didymodactylos carnosus]|uniref:BZIP domain-containing protein n=1 Tax=Didymodactylos carnosus TaxID=1234261 RepID=A0A813NMI3_9BILA|nr:unnamed protein product [Didymodactylos carnosus]CAF1098657.1 unnamed protein product [Didymodactylos carnosus]CAF3519222.1 unnamed protein product [Didymodactylos carnosus]CAF3860099.1 unnamed protein product [Didymodactylos carnosus]